MLGSNGRYDFGSSGRAALEDRSPDRSPVRSPVRSPLRGSRLAALPQGLGYGGVGSGDNDGLPGGPGDGVYGGVPYGIDEYGGAFGETAGSTTSSTQGVSGGEEEDDDEEGEMANFMVLDCSKVTNVS